MGINLDKPHLWKQDIIQSVDLYNTWFMDFAPKAFRETRVSTAKNVEEALKETNYLNSISPAILQRHPEVLPILRMSTCPPIARDRLIGLAGVSKNLVQNMEDSENPRVSPRMNSAQLITELQHISNIIIKMADPDIFTWLPKKRNPDETEIIRSSTIIADRLCGAVADPIIRNAQEKRQLAAISELLQSKGYSLTENGRRFNEMTPGSFSFHTNILLSSGRRVIGKNPRRRGCVWGWRGGLGCGGGGRSGSGGSGGRWGRCRRTGRPSFHHQFCPQTGNRYSSGRSSFGTTWGSRLSLMFVPIIHAFRANCYGTFYEKAVGSPNTAAGSPPPPFPGPARRKTRRRASFPRAAAARR